MKCSINNFGVINNGKMYINHHGRYIAIKVDDIIKIRFLKRRKLHFNFFLFFMAVFLFVSMYPFNYSNIMRLIIFCLTIFFLMMSYCLKLYEHKFVLIKKYNFFEFIIKKSLINDVENLISKYNLIRMN